MIYTSNTNDAIIDMNDYINNTVNRVGQITEREDTMPITHIGLHASMIRTLEQPAATAAAAVTYTSPAATDDSYRYFVELPNTTTQELQAAAIAARNAAMAEDAAAAHGEIFSNARLSRQLY